MNDLLPETLDTWQWLESVASKVLSAYGYRELRLPLVEKTELFARSIGELTDIVEKEMYTFEDRNGDSLTLRPEGTASCVRAGIEHGLLHNQTPRFWYAGPMFRHERPQKGRYRQFHQIGVETFGMSGPDIDAELILLTARLWKELGLEKTLTLEINTLGTPAARQAHKKVLVEYLTGHKDKLDADSLRRLDSNPLRILDSKDAEVKKLVKTAPSLMDYLDQDSQKHFAELRQYLDSAGVEYTVNSNLVRGLDYYTHTVFEWITDKLGAQNAVCAGGRFDGLVEKLGGNATPAAGFAIGLERLVELVTQAGFGKRLAGPQIYTVLLGEQARRQGLMLAEKLRDDQYRVQCHCGSGSMKSQMKKADTSGAQVALILGDDEIEKGVVGIKFLRENKPQEVVSLDALQPVLSMIQ